MALGCDRCGNLLDHVLIHTERLVELPKRLFEPVHHGATLVMIEALRVDTVDAVREAERPGFRQECVAINEAPHRQQAVEAARFSVVLQDPAYLHHAAPASGTMAIRDVFAAS